jgi:hypothetical protein
MRNLLLRSCALTMVLVIAFLATACPNEDTVVDGMFKTMGLNRLHVITTKVKPAGIILTKKNKVYYIGEVPQFAGATPPAFTVQPDDAVIAAKNANVGSGATISIFNPKSNSTKEVASNVNTAIDSVASLDTFLPVKADGKIDFSAAANFEQIEAKDFSIPVAEINEYVYGTKSAAFKNAMKPYAKEGYNIYIIYEAFQANKLHITSEGGKEIGANVNVNQVVEIGGGAYYRKTSNTSLVVDGTKYYTFAVRTLQLTYKNDQFTILPGIYKGTGLGGGDEKYSVPIVSDPENAAETTDFTVIDEIQYEKPELPKKPK